jgi:hypothetical protein
MGGWMDVWMYVCMYAWLLIQQKPIDIMFLVIGRSSVKQGSVYPDL